MTIRPSWRAPLLAAACLLAVCLPAAPAAATLSPTTYFWISCGFTGIRATVDPIVDPGSTTTGHYHDFFGNTSIGPNSTPDSLRASPSTTCTTSTDTASYWAPALVLGPGETQTYGPPGDPCTVDAAGLTSCDISNVRPYYSTGGSTRSLVHVPPAEMEAVGGNHGATGPQPLNEIGWACGGSSPFEQYPYDCTSYINTTGNHDQDGVVLRVVFPRCWDGTGTQPADFAYPNLGTGIGSCPTGFTTGLALIDVRFHTGIVNPCLGETDANGNQIACPAGSQVTPNFGFEMNDGTMMPWYQAHGDFMNGWQLAPQDNPGGLDDLVTDCLIKADPCPVNPHTAPTSNMPT